MRSTTRMRVQECNSLEWGYIDNVSAWDGDAYIQRHGAEAAAMGTNIKQCVME
jgi:hypothetical protein